MDMPTTNDIKTENIEENILCHPAGDLLKKFEAGLCNTIYFICIYQCCGNCNW